MAPPIPVLLIYGAGGAQTSQTVSLQDSAGNLVSVGSATDTQGQTVVTASLNTTHGGIIGLQSAPPGGLTLDGRPSGDAPTLPTVTDSQGATVPYGVAYDQHGGAVLSVSLSDQTGKTTTFYSQVDSLGFPISGSASASGTLPAFSTNPALTADSTPTLPDSLQPFTTPSSTTGSTGFAALGGRGSGRTRILPTFGFQTGQTLLA